MNYNYQFGSYPDSSSAYLNLLQLKRFEEDDKEEALSNRGKKRKVPNQEEAYRAGLVISDALKRMRFPDPLELSRPIPVNPPLEGRVILGNRYQTREGVVQNSEAEPPIQSLKEPCPAFPKSSVCLVEQGQYLILGGTQKSLITKGVGPGLAVGIQGYDGEGKLCLRALGHFSPLQITAFIIQHPNKIHDFLDQVYRATPNCVVFLAGMYDRHLFETVKTLIKYKYPIEMKAVINPWNIPTKSLQILDDEEAFQILFYKQDLNKYLCERGTSLSLSMPENGEISVTDDRTVVFEPFSEEAFEEWRRARALSSPL